MTPRFTCLISGCAASSHLCVYLFEILLTYLYSMREYATLLQSIAFLYADHFQMAHLLWRYIFLIWKHYFHALRWREIGDGEIIMLYSDAIIGFSPSTITKIFAALFFRLYYSRRMKAELFTEHRLYLRKNGARYFITSLARKFPVIKAKLGLDYFWDSASFFIKAYFHVTYVPPLAKYTAILTDAWQASPGHRKFA